jgi:hypothetical protein
MQLCGPHSQEAPIIHQILNSFPCHNLFRLIHLRHFLLLLLLALKMLRLLAQHLNTAQYNSTTAI